MHRDSFAQPSCRVRAAFAQRSQNAKEERTKKEISSKAEPHNNIINLADNYRPEPHDVKAIVILPMATLSFNWLLASMKGKACRHDEVYTKTNKQTGKSYAVKLCNPADPTLATAAQKTQRSKFGVISRAVSAWLETEKAKEGGDGSVAYNKALAAYRSQHKIGSFRGFVMSKYVTYDAATKQVTITVGATTSTVSGGSTPGGGSGSGSTPATGGDL